MSHGVGKVVSHVLSEDDVIVFLNVEMKGAELVEI